MAQQKSTFVKRKFRLFPRELREVVHQISKPMLGKHGAIISALLRHWPEIVGKEHATHIFFKEVRFTHASASAGTLVIEVAPHLQPEIPYLTPMLLERCAYILGYRAVEKILALPMQTSMNKSGL